MLINYIALFLCCLMNAAQIVRLIMNPVECEADKAEFTWSLIVEIIWFLLLVVMIKGVMV